MRTIRASAHLIFFLLIMVMAQSAHAQGVIVPGPCERCPRPPRPITLPPALPVKSIKIETKINAQVATTHVEQVFRNDSDATLEGTFFFPIPEAASIAEFAIWDGDRRLVGEVRSREEARRIYDEIVRRKRDPGLLEYAGKDLFQASIFPIPPHSDKKLELTYTQVLRAEAGTVSYRYPLGTGHNTQQIGAVSGRVELDSREPLRNIYSPSHAIEVARRGEGRALVSFETTGAQTPQDFQLFYGLSKDDFGVSLLTYREPGKDGYFLLLVSPKNELTDEEYAAKDVLFVLDTSGSMADQGKMEKARAALLFGIKSLRSEDRFNVVSFAGEERLMERGLIAADEAGRSRGVEYVNALRPTGGTNINDSLLAAIRQFSQSERPRIIVFMTDGLPTVSETNPQRIIENVARARVPGVRLFTFGVGYDVNTALLDKLAADNGGVAEYIEPREDIEIKVSSFFAKINYPVLTDLKLEMGGVETDLVYPRNLPDLFKGTQIALIGRYRNAVDLGHVRLSLTGRTGTRSQTFYYDDQRFPLKAEKNDFLPRLWATRRVGWLMEQIRTNGEQRELRDEVVDLGTRYGIVTPYTSYLALESDDATQVTAGNRPASGGAGNNNFRVNGADAGAAPSGTSTMTARAPIPKAAARATTGAVAVQQSKRDRAQQETVRVESESSAGMRNVAGKTFYLREGVWVDSEFKAESRLPETSLVFGSDEYFALLKREPRLADFFSLGERVVVVYQGRVYRVTAMTK
ncbi:MAG TPA: VIT and VWA domain-containing protein [Pyrinomonadaceae bacterium]|jgi:Ca-activated chloride channel family protein|nr:VIT and VWA domain-containing protein [Pyrinomonadaceae bacterium]